LAEVWAPLATRKGLSLELIFFYLVCSPSTELHSGFIGVNVNQMARQIGVT
jgi:hypothetical protein